MTDNECVPFKPFSPLVPISTKVSDGPGKPLSPGSPFAPGNPFLPFSPGKPEEPEENMMKFSEETWLNDSIKETMKLLHSRATMYVNIHSKSTT